jgi:predicted transcriptional regulator
MRHELLERVLERFAGDVQGVSGINTLPVRVIDQQGRPTFGARSVAGVSGSAIRGWALDFVHTVAALKSRRTWGFEIIGMGGVMTSDDVREFLRAGADAVQTATAAEDNPSLPGELLREPDEGLTPFARTVLSTLEVRPGADIAQLASAARLSLATVRAALSELRTRGVVREAADERGHSGYQVDEHALEQQLA